MEQSPRWANMYMDFTEVWSGGNFLTLWASLTQQLHQLFHAFSLLCKDLLLKAHSGRKSEFGE